MEKIIHFTTTGTEEWKIHCMEWAKSRKPFRVYGVEKQHLGFCDDLCRLNQYKYKFNNDSTATFLPVE